MNSPIKKILLFVAVLVLSYLSAKFFGDLYNQFDPQQGSAFWGLDRSDATSFAGFLLAYVFFIPLMFGLFNREKKNHWIIILLLPIIIFYLYAKASVIYIPVIAIGIGYMLAYLFRLVSLKLRHPQTLVR